MIKQMQEGFDTENAVTLSNGQIDPVSLIYSTENIPSFAQPVAQNINGGNAYNITYNDAGYVQAYQGNIVETTIPLLLPGILSK